MSELIVLGFLAGVCVGIWLRIAVESRRLRSGMFVGVQEGVVYIGGEKVYVPLGTVQITSAENKVSGLRVTGVKEER